MRSLVLGIILSFWLGAAGAQQDTDSKSDSATAAAASGESSGGGGKAFDVKSSFRNICSFCHQDYGRHAGKGPQLMNSPRSDEFLFNRIKHGVAGRMPGFGSTFTDDQIQQIVRFIRNLKPDEEPKNPA